MTNEATTKDPKIQVRADQQLVDRFKDLSEKAKRSKGMTQGAFVSYLLDQFDLEDKKYMIPNRATEIEDFQHKLYSLANSFNRALEICEDTEVRVRKEYEKQLDSQLDTIAELREKDKLREEEKKAAIDQATIVTQQAKEAVDLLRKENAEYLKQIDEMKIKLETAETNLINNNEVLAVFKQKSLDFEEDAKKYKEASEEIKILDNKILVLEKEKSDLIKDHALELKNIELANERKLTDIEKSISAELNAKYTQEINSLKEDHKEEVNSLKLEVRELRAMLYGKKTEE